MKNWKTSLFGTLALVGAYLVKSEVFPSAYDIYINCFTGLCALLCVLSAKDFDVSSSDLPNSIKTIAIFAVMSIATVSVNAQTSDTATRYSSAPASGYYGNICFNGSKNSTGFGGISAYSPYFSYSTKKATVALPRIPTYTSNTAAQNDTTMHFGYFYRITNDTTGILHVINK